MAPTGWRSTRSVIEQLAAEAHRFDALQAITVIERLFPLAASVAEGGNAAHEAVRFRSSLTTAFPASDLSAAHPPRPDAPQWEILVNFLGLAGGFGPLPVPFTEAIIQQTRAGDSATRDFLDIFNHRLVSILYRARRLHRPALSRQAPDVGPVAEQLYSLIGLGTPGLRGRLSVPDRALLNHAGALAQQPRSLHGLECLLNEHFGVPIRVIPLQGGWLRLDDSQVTRLGQRNAVLGDGAVLGRRVWDQQAAVVLEVGPLDLDGFRAFLPGGHAAQALRDLAGFYAGAGIEFRVRLRLRPSAVPGTRLVGANRLHLQSPKTLAAQTRASGVRLGGEGRLLTHSAAPDAPRLGWTSWLTSRPRQAEGVVTPHAAA